MDDGSRRSADGRRTRAGGLPALVRRPGVLVGVLVGLAFGLVLFGDDRSPLATGALCVVFAAVGGAVGHLVVVERRPRA